MGSRDQVGARDELAVIEAEVAAVFEDVLRIDSAGREDDFFELGGHSLLATVLISQLNERFGRKLTPAVLFTAPTVAELAERVAEQAVTPDDEPPSLRPRQDRPARQPASRSQASLYRELADGVRLPVLGMNVVCRLTGPLRVDALTAAVAGLVERHDVFRTSLVRSGGEVHQDVRPEVEVPLATVTATGDTPAEREAWAHAWVAEEVRREFPGLAAPLLRVSVVRLGDQEHLLALVMHHLIGDGWSLGLVTADLASGYRAAVADTAPPARPELQFSDWSQWQRALLDGGRGDELAGYWRDKLSRGPQPLSVRLPGYDPELLDEGGTLALDLPVAVAGVLRGFARDEGVTLFSAVLGALVTLVAHRSGQPEFTVLTSFVNRGTAATQSIIGWLAHSLALRVDVSGTPSFRDVAHRAQAETGASVEHGELPSSLMRRLVPGDGGPETYFAVNESWGAAFELDGVTSSQWDVDDGSSTPGLQLRLLDRGDGLTLWLGYAGYRREYAEGLLDALVGLLRTGLDDPDTALAATLAAPAREP